MLPIPHRPCALVAGDPPIMTVRRTAVLVITVSLLLGAHLFGDDPGRLLLVLLAYAGVPAGLSVSRPLVVLNLRSQRPWLGAETVGDI